MPPQIDFVPDVQNDEGAPGAIDFQPDQAAAEFAQSALDSRPTFIPTLPPAETSPKLEAAKEMALALPQAFGIGLGAVEKGVGAAIGQVAGTGDNLDDVRRAVEEGTPLPVELAAERARGIGGTLARVGLGLAETAPKIAAMSLFPGSILSQSIAAGGIFGLDAQGRFSPRAAAVGALLPGAGALAKEAIARGLASAMERGTIGTMHPATQWITEEMGHQAALNAVMLTADSPELIELYHTDRDAFRRKIEDTIGMNLAFGLFGGFKRLRGAPTSTQEYVRKNAEKFTKIADKMITQQIVGGEGQQAIEKAIADAQARQKYAGFLSTPRPETPAGFIPELEPQLPPVEPKGPANAIQIGVPAPLPVEVPPEARPEVGGQVRKPEEPAEARPPAEAIAPPVEPAKPVEAPKQPDVPQLSGLPEDIRQLFAGTPPPPKKKSIPIVIEIDGVQQPAYFEGYGTTATSLEPINPWISRLSDGGWTTGPIQPDAKIVWGKIPEAPKPAEEKPPEKAPEAQKPAAEPPAIDRSRTFTEQEAEDAGIASQLAREGWSFNLFDRKWSFKQTEPPKPTEPEAKPEETVAREPDQLQRFVGIVKLAADSPDKLRSSDVDRVMSEVSPEEVEAFRTWLLSKALPDDTIKEVVNWKPEQPTEAKPPTEFPQYPKPLTKEERKKNVFGAISKRIKAWEDSIKQWLTGRPENKAIIWEEPEIQGVKGPAKGNVKALTRNIGDDKNPWRVTVFNERNGAYMPFGHRVYPTREAALVEEARDVLKLHDSMPGRVMDEQEVQGYKLMKDVPDQSKLVWYKFTVEPRILRERLRGTALMEDFVRDSQTADGKVAFTKPVTADLQDPAKIADRLKWLGLEEVAGERGLVGKPFSVVTPENDVTAKGEYELIDLSKVIISDQPGYDPDLQPRDRSRQASVEQIEKIEREINPARLAESPTSDVGAPILNNRNMALTGNGRLMAIRLHYDRGNTVYRDWLLQNLQQYGIDPAAAQGMERPVLVRRGTDFSGVSEAAFAEKSNRSSVAGMSDAEKARADAMFLERNQNVLDLFLPSDLGDILAESNRPFLQAFVNSVSDKESLLTKTGWNAAALPKRVKNALLAMVLGPERAGLITDLVESAAELNVSNSVTGLMRSIPKLMKLRGSNYDVTTPLGQALSDLVTIRRTGQKVEEFLASKSMFGDEGRTAQSDSLLYALAKARSAKQIEDVLGRYIRTALEARADEQSGGLFGEKPKTAEELLKIANEKELGKAEEPPGEPPSPAGEPVKPPTPPVGPGVQGPGPGPAQPPAGSPAKAPTSAPVATKPRVGVRERYLRDWNATDRLLVKALRELDKQNARKPLLYKARQSRAALVKYLEAVIKAEPIFAKHNAGTFYTFKVVHDVKGGYDRLYEEYTPEELKTLQQLFFAADELANDSKTSPVKGDFGVFAQSLTGNLQARSNVGYALRMHEGAARTPEQRKADKKFNYGEEVVFKPVKPGEPEVRGVVKSDDGLDIRIAQTLGDLGDSFSRLNGTVTGGQQDLLGKGQEGIAKKKLVRVELVTTEYPKDGEPVVTIRKVYSDGTTEEDQSSAYSKSVERTNAELLAAGVFQPRRIKTHLDLDSYSDATMRKLLEEYDSEFRRSIASSPSINQGAQLEQFIKDLKARRIIVTDEEYRRFIENEADTHRFSDDPGRRGFGQTVYEFAQQWVGQPKFDVEPVPEKKGAAKAPEQTPELKPVDEIQPGKSTAEAYRDAIMRAASMESIGGNAGPGAAGVNFLFNPKTGEVVYWGNWQAAPIELQAQRAAGQLENGIVRVSDALTKPWISWASENAPDAVKALVERSPAETPKAAKIEPRLSDREQKRLSDLQMKDRAYRDAIGRNEPGEALTAEEQREYEALTAKAGQRTLFDVDEVVAETSRPVLEGQLRNLEEKLAELKRQQLLSLTNAQNRQMGGDKAKEFMEAARTYEKRIGETQNEIVDIKRKLRIGLNAEEYKAAPVEPTSVEDLFSQPERPKAPTPPKAAEPVNASQENMRAEIADIERKLQLLDLEWTDANGKNRKKKAMELGSEINKLNMRLNLLRSDLTEGQGEVVLRTPIAENPLTGEYESREYRLRQMTSQEFMDYFKDPMQRMQEFDTVYTPWRAEMRRVYYDESGKETRHDPWYIDAIQKTREGAIEKAASYSGRSAEGWKEVLNTLNKPKGPEISPEQPSAPISAGKKGVSKGAGAAAQPVKGLSDAESARLAELTDKVESGAKMTKAERERFIELQTKAGARGGDERPEVRPGGDEPPANLGGGLEPGQGMRSEAEVHAAIAGEDTAGFPVKVITQQQAVELTGRAEARGYGGFFWKGSVYMVRDNLSPDPKYREQVRQLLREEVGHGLLRTQAGLRLLSEVLDAGKLNLTDAERQKLLDMGYREHQLLDEFIAKSARENLPWWKEMVERARVLLSKLGLAKLSNEEVSRMLLRQIRAEMLDKADAPIGLPAVSAGPSVGGKLLPGFDRMRSPRTKIKDLKPGDLIRFNGNLFGVDRVESDAVMKNEAKLFLSNEQGSGSVTIGNKNDPLSNWEPVSESVLQSAGLARFREGPAPAPAVGREPEIPTPEGERPSGPKMGVTQVAGEKIGIERPMEFIAGIRQRLRTGYFDGSQPVEPGRTENAWQIAQMMVNPETRGTFASDLQRAGGGEMAPGLLRNELWNYAVRQAVRGDTRLMEFMVRQSQNFQTLAGEALADGDTALGRGLRAARNRAFGGLWSRLIGFRNEQLAATGRRLQQGEAGLRQIIEAIDGLVANIGDIDAFERGLRTPEIQRIIDRTSDTGRAADEVVGNATFVPPERRASILETVYQWMSREVDPRADQAPFVDTLKAELERLRLTPEQAQTIADATWNRKLTVDGVVRRRLWDKELRKLDALAEKTADSFILSVDQAEWKRPEQPNEVRDIIKEALKSEAPLDSNNLLGFKRDLTQRLITAGLSEEKARDLANAITTRRETDLLNAQLRVRNRAVESKSLKSLVESLRSSPYLAQNDPQWRFDTAVRWFESNGVPREQAQEAAKLFDEQFVAALTKAAEQAAKRLITKGDYGRNIPELIEAIRLGLTDPSKNWTEEIAKREGFRPMSREDQQRLAELEQKYSNPNLSAHEQVALVEQMMGIVRHAGDSKGRVMQIMGESFAASLLSGIRTMTLNWMQPWFTMLATGASHAAFEPRDFPTVVRSMWNASKNWWPEYKYAWSKDAYELSSEEQVFHSNALKTAFEDAQTDWAKGRYSQAILKFTYGWQQYVIRGLQAADQAGMVVAREWKMALYGSIAMRAAGLKTAQITELVDVAEGFKRAEYERALYDGKSHNEAQVIANEATIDALTNFFENKLGSRQKAEAVEEAALYDAFNIVGRRAPGVDESDEGFLSRYSGLNRIMRFVSETRREGGGASMLTIMAVGFMNVPLRTARFYAGFGPYGILRWGIDKYRTNRGYAENLWKQSYKNEYQSKARLREALIGTSLMLAFLGWQHRHHTSDEDAEKKAFAMYVTGNGPSNKTMRDAWLKRGFEPYTLHVIANGKIRSKLPVNRVGQILAFPLGLAASLDDLAWRRKQEEATSPGSKKEFAGREIVAAMGTYYNIVGAQGVLQAFSHLSQMGQGQSGTGRAVGVSLASTASALAIPGKSLIQCVTDMITGPVDRSSVEAAMISNFPVLNVLWNGQAINRFGDPIGDRTWSAKLTKLGFPVLLRVSDTPENKALYQMILDKGAPPPDLRRYIVEDKYGPLSQDDWQKFVKISGSALKSEVLSNLDTLNSTDPHGVKLFMNRAADIANDQAAQALHLTPKPTISASSGGSGGSAVPTLPKGNVGLPSSARISVPGGASGGRISTGGGSRGYGGGFGPGTTGIRRGTTGRLSLSGFTGGQRRFVHGRLRAHVTRVRGIGRKSRVSIPRRSFRRRRISLRA